MVKVFLFARLTTAFSNRGVVSANSLLPGQPIDVNFITYAQLMEGGELRFTLSDKPNMERGVSSEASPYSYTKDEVVSIPYVDK